MENPIAVKPIVIREVWAENLDFEMKMIESIVDDFPYIAMDTEYPGFKKWQPTIQNPTNFYSLLRTNVAETKLIQLGITLVDYYGNLPDFGTDSRYIWQFNFRDFNLETDNHSSKSIALLKEAGIDFVKNREMGIDSVMFAELIMPSGMICNNSVYWIVFEGGYDFAYLIKILTQRDLPEERSDFCVLLDAFFGGNVLDMRYVLRQIGMRGKLWEIAWRLDVNREVGLSHQAGSDSLMTIQVLVASYHKYVIGTGALRLTDHLGKVNWIS